MVYMLCYRYVRNMALSFGQATQRNRSVIQFITQMIKKQDKTGNGLKKGFSIPGLEIRG